MKIAAHLLKMYPFIIGQLEGNVSVVFFILFE